MGNDLIILLVLASILTFLLVSGWRDRLTAGAAAVALLLTLILFFSAV